MDERQRQARTTVQALRLHHYQEKNSVNKEEAIRLAKADIERLCKQGDPSTTATEPGAIFWLKTSYNMSTHGRGLPFETGQRRR
jgi:hypothetical protein